MSVTSVSRTLSSPDADTAPKLQGPHEVKLYSTREPAFANNCHTLHILFDPANWLLPLLSFIAVHRFSKEMLRKKERIVPTSLSRETEVLEPVHRQAWVLGLPWTFYTDLEWGRELCLSVWGLLHFPVCWLERPGIWSQRSVKYSDLEHTDVGSNIYLLPGGPQTWLFKLSKSPFSPVWSRG